MGCQLGVVVGVPPGLRVGVYQRGGQARQRVQQVVLGADRDLVRGDGAGTGVDDDLAFGAQLVADPAEPDLAGVAIVAIIAASSALAAYEG